MATKGMADTGAARSANFNQRLMEEDASNRRAAADASAVMTWEQGKRGAADQMRADENSPATDMSPPTGDYAYSEPAPKPKFSASRAMEFSDGGGGYTYLIDPQTKVVKIAKAPASNKKAEGALLTGQGKNKAAYDAIWAKYGDKVEKLATRNPLDIEVGDDVEEEIGETPPDKFMSTRGMDGGPNAAAGAKARKSLIGGSFG